MWPNVFNSSHVCSSPGTGNAWMFFYVVYISLFINWHKRVFQSLTSSGREQLSPLFFLFYLIFFILFLFFFQYVYYFTNCQWRSESKLNWEKTYSTTKQFCIFQSHFSATLRKVSLDFVASALPQLVVSLFTLFRSHLFASSFQFRSVQVKHLFWRSIMVFCLSFAVPDQPSSMHDFIDENFTNIFFFNFCGEQRCESPSFPAVWPEFEFRRR